MEVLYVRTAKREQELRSKGYKVTSIWEHEFHQLLKSDVAAKTFTEGLEVVDRLKPRDAFFGGRTNACRLHYAVEEGESIKYMDFTSLYPFVNKYCRYPVGHPKIITTDFQPIEQYFGLAKVNILH
jgi:hypothetical protein